MLRRLLWAAVAAVIGTTVAITALAAGTAQAAPAKPTVTVDGAASVFDSTVTTTYTVTVAGGSVSALNVVTHQDPRLPADADSVTDALVDGDTPSVGAVTLVGPDLRFVLGALGPGTHTVTFSVSLPTLDPAIYSSYATVQYSVAGVTQTAKRSAAVPVPVGQDSAPAVDLSVDLGDAGTASDPILVESGQTGDLFAYVSNAGRTPTAATILLTAGAGLILGDVTDIDPNSVDGGVSALACQAVPGRPDQKRCQLPSFGVGADNGHIIDASVTIATDQATGATAVLTLAAIPAPSPGIEADPSDNSVESTFQLAGTADLSYTLSPSTVRIKVGQLASIVATVTNHGPDVAPAATAYIDIPDLTGAFEFIDFTGTTDDGGGGGGPIFAKGSVQERLEAARRLVLRERLATPVSDPSQVIWLIGDLPAGQSISATLRVRADSAGRETVEIVANADASDPDCLGNTACPEVTTSLVALAPVRTPSPTPSSSTPTTTPTAGTTSPGGDGLANTGSQVAGLGLLAVILLAVGAGLLALGYPRRPHRH